MSRRYAGGVARKFGSCERRVNRSLAASQVHEPVHEADEHGPADDVADLSIRLWADIVIQTARHTSTLARMPLNQPPQRETGLADPDLFGLGGHVGGEECIELDSLPIRATYPVPRTLTRAVVPARRWIGPVLTRRSILEVCS